MRILAKALTTLTFTLGTVAATAAPAAASHQCVSSDLVCVITTATTIPVGTPVAGPVGTGAFRVPLGNVCLPTCETVYLIVPGALVSSSGATLATITLPEYGVRISSTGFPSVYGGIPTVSPGIPGGAGLSLFLQVPYVPVITSSIGCAPTAPTSVGPVTFWLGGCLLNVRVTL
ncbi:MAG TPA: hypothetical protein VNA20_07390 [Frankiaceae bacterium]|nr:hypothetical protein [Frankiaceae bacterium]